MSGINDYLRLLGRLLEARANDDDETALSDELDGVWHTLSGGERLTANLAAQLTCVGTTYTRADLVRAILGQQWAVAIALHSSIYGAKRMLVWLSTPSTRCSHEPPHRDFVAW